MGESLYKQSRSVLYNPERTSVPVAHCDFVFNISCVDLLCDDAVGVPHRHNSEFEVHYVLEGSLELNINGDHIVLNENDYLCIAPGVFHYTLYDPLAKNQYFVVVFNLQRNRGGRSVHREQSMDLVDILRGVEDRKYCAGADRQDLGQYIMAMTREVWYGELGWKSLLHSYYVLFLYGILRNLSAGVERERYDVTENAAVRINKYLSEHYSEDITLQHVADIMCYSPRHVNRILNRYFNSSFTKTISRYRVNYAKNYLVESDYSIEKIASLVGYSSPNTLFKLFKEMEGVTPGQYRELHRADRGGAAQG